MKIAMKKIYKKIAVLLVVLAGACNMDGDLTNPNEVSVTGADVNLILNGIQLDFADFFNNAHGTVGPLIRYQTMTGGFRYSTAYQPQGQNELWRLAYQNVLINSETVVPLAASKGLSNHVAVAKILEAYTLITLVDIFGDVPSTSALKANEGNFNPTADAGSDVYARAIALLAEARTEIAKAGPAMGRDIYYSGSMANWGALANSIELKAQLNMSIMPGAAGAAANTRIAQLLTSNLIDATNGSEDFTYKYAAVTVPDSRHPYYNQYYGPNAGQAGGYICTTILWEAFRGKPDPTDPTNATKFTQDPRWRYYFYRQMGSIDAMQKGDPKALGCTIGANPSHYIAGNYPFCAFDPGFYGRDHGDASGTPPDPPWITAAGVYPAGGKLDQNTAAIPTTNSFKEPTKRGDGADGRGIQPIFMHPYTDYMKAEILARGGNTAGARTQLMTAIDNSINSVRAFATSKNATLGAGVEPSTTNYKNAVGYLYDNASNKLKIIGREFWVASWGNGVEAYNSYRRTSGPDIMQPTLQTNPGPWLRSMIYSANYVNLNSSAVQKPVDTVVKVFWDANPDVLN